MISLFEALQTREKPKSKITNKRQDLLRMILEEVNKERPTKYKNSKGKWVVVKEMKPRALAILLSHVETEDLYPFHRQCMDYKHRQRSYSKCLFGSIKAK